MTHNVVDVYKILMYDNNMELNRYDSEFIYSIRHLLEWEVWREDQNENGKKLYSGSDFDRAMEAFINNGSDERQ